MILALLLAAPPAHACVCGDMVLGTVPSGEDAEVPVEGPILVAWSSAGEVDYELVDLATGSPVAVSIERTLQAEAPWDRIVPDEPLVAGGAYSLHIVGEYSDEAVQMRAVEAVGAPGAVELGELEGRFDPDSDCGEISAISGRLTGDSASVVEVQVSRDEAFDEPEVVLLPPDNSLHVGANGCHTNLEGLVEGERVWVRARAVSLDDVAGEWSEPREAQIGGGALACATGGGGGAGALLPVLLLSLRRGRSPRRR